MNKLFATADHIGSVLYTVRIILTNWQTAKLGAPRYNGNHAFLVSSTQEVEVTHPKRSSSGYITRTHIVIKSECT